MWRISILLLGIAAPAAAAFEIAGRGAQSAALGGAFVAGVKTAEAVWYNPAGNARVQQWQAGTTHALLYPGLEESPSLHGLALAAPLGGGGLQAGLSLLSAEGWREEVAVLGYGRALTPRVALGGGLRSSAWKAGALSHRAWSLEVGGTYEVGFVLPHAYLRLGLVLRDLNRANIAAGGQVAGQTPRAVVLAAALALGAQQVLIDVERRNGHLEIRAGYETRTISLGGARFRLGGSAREGDWGGGELDVGIGHDWEPWHFDYAYTYPLHLSGLGGMHRLSLGYRRR